MARQQQKSWRQSPQDQPDHPCAMVLTVSFVLPGDRAFFAPVTCGLIRKLDTSVGVSGPHDFAVRQNAVRPHENSRASPSRPSQS
jgi:hypothetical protein